MKPLLLSTKRVILRCTQDGDAEHLFRNYCSESSSSRFLTREPHRHIDQTSNFLNAWCKAAWEQDSNQFAWVISLADTNEAIGVFLVEVDGHKAQIHYGIGSNFGHQGIVTEAGETIVNWLITQPNLQRIWAVCDLLNLNSIKVLEKLQFQKEGILRKWLNLPSFGHAARDCYIYARTNDSVVVH